MNKDNLEEHYERPDNIYSQHTTPARAFGSTTAQADIIKVPTQTVSQEPEDKI
jgi:hypothetical protein